ncbi:MAG: HAMP domain-containing sensor histidine kinase [Candidatus Delongbacteria bacterium]|nr:HAMP domain-containing sensor histidine kinase [Candidatus Delongbacteria bacterium]
MKFLSKINRNYFFLLLIIMIIVSVAGYFILQFIILDDARENLTQNEALIINQIIKTGEIPNIHPIVEITRINNKTVKESSFKEINMPYEGEEETFLEYSNQVKIKDSFYQITLRETTFEKDNLVILLAMSFIVLLTASFGISFFVSKKMNKTIWVDFESNLEEIENFSLSGESSLSFIQTDIEEFDRLNTVINKLTKKLKSDFVSLKEFTESASHEIQTPLAVVLLNLEEVLQQDLNKDTFEKVIASINAIKRLSNLNKSLILMTKIENNQFKADNLVSISDLFKHKIDEYSTLFESKKLNTEINIDQDFGLRINEQIADILINNLLSNAIKHNFEGGKIQIYINKNEFRICNTGEDHFLTNDNIFNRFVKGNPGSYGLGLSIVKKICESQNLNIQYEKKELHCFIIKSN